MKTLLASQGKIEDYESFLVQMCVIMFGVITLSTILMAVVVVSSLLETCRILFNSAVYMDDILVCSKNEKLLIQSILTAIPAAGEAGFKLHKVQSTSLAIQKKFGIVPIPNAKLLGLSWNRKSDCIPIQNTSIENYWDNETDENSRKNIMAFVSEIAKFSKTEVPRAVDSSGDMICFSDASELGYGYVIYIGNSIFFAKSTVLPKKTVVVLELQALFEWLQAIEKVVDMISFSVKNKVLSDSSINLCRLTQAPNDYNSVAVSRRFIKVLQIANRLRISCIHVPGLKNPADIYSQGTTVKDMTKQNIFRIDPDRYRTCLSKFVPILSILILKNDFYLAPIFRIVKKFKEIRTKKVKKSSLSPFESIAYVYQQSCKVLLNQFQADERDLIRDFAKNNKVSPLWIPKKTKIADYVSNQAHVLVKTTDPRNWPKKRIIEVVSDSCGIFAEYFWISVLVNRYGALLTQLFC